jgi:hypothetical protein
MSETRKDTPAMSRTIDAISGNTTQFATAMIGGQLFGLPISRLQDVFMPERLTRAREQMTSLASSASTLPAVAKCLEEAGGDLGRASFSHQDEAVLDELYVRYTMERERDVHRQFLLPFGIATKQAAPAATDCDFELF